MLAFAFSATQPLSLRRLSAQRASCCPVEAPTMAAAASRRQKRRKRRLAPPAAEDATLAYEEPRRGGVPASVLNCVVKLYVTHSEPNYSSPWVIERSEQSTSTGFIIQGRRIVTCAHCCQHATVVKVKRRGSDVKYLAKVTAVGNECDTATLSVEDNTFWDGIENVADELRALPWLDPGPLPQLQGECAVIGYPSPGESICVTAGVCSRVEVQPYVYATSSLLAVQLDAAINSGNSGGPVVDHRLQVVGIAFQSVDASENESVGYFVPWLIVQHFLDDLKKNNVYTGFPEPGFRYQNMESLAMRAALGLPPNLDGSGILVKTVDATSDAARVLKRGDIVVGLDGLDVSNSGTVPFSEQPGERIDLSFLVTSRFVGDDIRVRFWRDSELHEATYKLPAMCDARLVKSHAPRQYVVYGGLVFVQLSEPYLDCEFDDYVAHGPLSLLEQFYHGRLRLDGRTEVVVLAHVLASPCNMGYEDHRASEVLKVNGHDVKNLAHLSELLYSDSIGANPSSSEASNNYVRFDLDRDNVILMERKACSDELQSILEMHAIPSPRLLAETGC